MIRYLATALLLTLGVGAGAAHATTGQPLAVNVRGQALTLTVYVPRAGTPARGSVLMASGDVGWVGLAETLAEYLSDEGFVVAGINVRQYLSAFATNTSHLEVAQIPLDYAQFATALRSRGWLARPTVVAGVSEGAALSIAAAASAQARPWVDGVITMGLPATAELAWRWKDALTWMTKTDANEPSFSPHEIIAQVSPIPLWMLQSTNDEYVPEADYRRFERLAAEPKRFVLISAKNHRFTDKLPDLKAQVLAAIAWIDGLRGRPGPP